MHRQAQNQSQKSVARHPKYVDPKSHLKIKLQNTKPKGVSASDLDPLCDELESSLMILEDLIAIAIQEIGNDTGRALSVLLPSVRYIKDLKSLNQRLLQLEPA